MASSDSNSNLYIVVGGLVGFLCVTSVVSLILYSRSNSSRTKSIRSSKGPIFGRSVTPVNDAEIESWRKPAASPRWQENESRRHILASPPKSAHTSQSSRWSGTTSIQHSWDVEAAMQTPIHSLEIVTEKPCAYVPKHTKTPSQSVHDRPPTPFLVSQAPATVDVPSPVSPSYQPLHRSRSHSSDLDIDFDVDFNLQQQQPRTFGLGLDHSTLS